MLETHLIRILLVDSYTMVREGIRLLLNQTPGLAVVGETGRYTDALMIAQQEQPDVILLDLTMISENGYNMLPRLLEVASPARLIILTESLDPQAHRAAIDLGAKGLVLKQESSEALIHAINKVHAGEISLEPLITDKLLSNLLSRSKPHDCEMQSSVPLTPREQQIVSLVAEGLRNKEVARNLLISAATVSHHLTSIFNKLGIPGRLQLVIYADRHGINRFSALASGNHAGD